MSDDGHAPYQPMSLGYLCEVKYQISRHLYFRQHPDGDELDLRRMLMTTERGQRVFERHIFDWQITPFEAVLEYLQRDFMGVFERADLTWDEAAGEVLHTRLGTRHPHDFHPVEGLDPEAMIDQQYPDARSKFEHLAGKFRRLLRSETPKLYVFRQIRIYDDTLKLLDLLRQHCDERASRVLYVDYEGEDQTLTAFGDEILKGWTPWQADKPEDRRWEGDDQAWDRILAPLPLALPGARLPRTFDESLKPEPVPATPAPTAPSGHWLRRLLRRV